MTESPEFIPPMASVVAVTPPRLDFVLEAYVECESLQVLGRHPLGVRRIAPIGGGSFAGPRIRGRVLRGGADRQLIRPDGWRELEAIYELETDDGTILSVCNRALVRDEDPEMQQKRYAFSHFSITAPEGEHDWLNRGVFVGTIDSLLPKLAVIVRVFKLS